MTMKQKVMQGTDLLYKRERALIFITALSFVAFSLYAGEIRWTGSGQTASMSDGDNWGGAAPGASDTAVVYGNTAATPAIAPGGNATYTGLWVSNYGDGFVLQTNGTLTVTGSDALRIGRCPGYTGHYTITNGTLKATTGSLFVGINGATGLLKISGRGIVEAPKLTVASIGPNQASTKTEGYIDVAENGHLKIAGQVLIGSQSGGSGYYGEVRQSGGTFSSAEFILGSRSAGVKYIQTGGMNAVSGKAYMGTYTGASGTYELSGGVFSVTNWLNVGGYDTLNDNTKAGEGTLIVSGTGTVDARNDFRVGNNGPGTLEQNGGAIHVKQDSKVGVNKKGVATMNSGEFTCGRDFLVGNTGYGEFHMKGGTLTITRYLEVAANGNGDFFQSGGHVQCNNIPYIGYNGTSASGSYVMTGGTFATKDQGFLVGNSGSGTLDVSGSAVMTINGNLNLGYNSSGKGTLRLHDGGKIIANHVKKYQGTAVLAQFDGGILYARQADDILKNLANVELKAGGLALETAGFNLGITNCVFNVTPGGKISVSGGGTVTFKADTSVNLTEKPASAFTFAETDGVFSGMPVAANMRRWKMVMSQDRKSIRIVPPGLMVIVK